MSWVLRCGIRRTHWKVLQLKPPLLIFVILLSILLFSIAVTGVQAQAEDNDGGEGGFEFHCSLGGISFLLVMATLAAGFLVSGRFGRLTDVKPLPLHKLVVVAMATYLTGEFVFGLVIRNIAFVRSMHGVLGFSVAALAWATASLNPLVLRRALKWKWASKIHLVFAAALFILLAIHLYYAFTILVD
jgi:hypothetical protein